mmetsp:Transcript_46715/g.144073  ORF Transcript_46715/g.144073 Transcript_46715/m.144073 type:complete len:268 (-) Transcript_46715:18-821(-)
MQRRRTWRFWLFSRGDGLGRNEHDLWHVGLRAARTPRLVALRAHARLHGRPSGLLPAQLFGCCGAHFRDVRDRGVRRVVSNVSHVNRDARSVARVFPRRGAAFVRRDRACRLRGRVSHIAGGVGRRGNHGARGGHGRDEGFPARTDRGVLLHSFRCHPRSGPPDHRARAGHDTPEEAQARAHKLQRATRGSDGRLRGRAGLHVLVAWCRLRRVELVTHPDVDGAAYVAFLVLDRLHIPLRRRLNLHGGRRRPGAVLVAHCSFRLRRQ